MPGPCISDHALLCFLERAGRFDVESLRDEISGALARAHEAAAELGGGDYLIKWGGSLFVVRGDTVTTVMPEGPLAARAHVLDKRTAGET